jgi:hypothetical protein
MLSSILSGLSTNKPYGAANGSLEELTSVSEGGLPHPNPATLNAVLLQLLGASTGQTGSIGSASGSLSSFVGLSGIAYALSTASLLPLTGRSYKFSDPTGEFYGRYNSYSLTAFATEGVSYGVDVSYGSYSFEARLGHKATTDYGGYALSATTTPSSGVIARAVLSYDGYDIEGRALPGSIVGAVLSYRTPPRLTSYTGAHAPLSYQSYSLSITATTGSVIRFADTYQGYQLSATLSGLIYGRAILSAGQLVPVYGIAQTSFGSYRLLSFGEVVVTSLGLAYVMNRRTNAMTRYTDQGFSHLVYFDGRHYGVKSDGLYLLEGETFEGGAIEAHVKTSKLDFDTQQHKRVPYAYIGNATELDVTVHTDGVEQGTYRSEHGAKRIRLARGPKGRYYEFEIANVEGQVLSIDGVEFIAEELRRRA